MKSKIKISKATIILLMVAFIGIAISGCGKTQTKLPLLKLPQWGGFTPHDFEVQLNADVSKLPGQATVYKVVPQKMDEQTVERLCKIFGVDISAVTIKDKASVVRRQNEKDLITYNDTGFYNFSTKNLFDYFPGKVVPPEEDCIKIAKSFAKKYNLLPKMYQYRIAIGAYTIYHPSFNESVITDRTVTFCPIINGKVIRGPNSIDITIGDKGEIEEVNNYLYNNIAPLKGDYALKSIDEVIKELKENSSIQWWIKPDEPDVKKVIINKVEIEYYGATGTSIKLEQPFIQPVYDLSGEVIFKNGKKGKFGVTVPAIDNQYIITGN
ncbi:MAG: hypothetical protein J7J57_00660 [Caldisericaceae bacterium]|nr:hypothetical protein [Caldisericaceae bacterium]